MKVQNNGTLPLKRCPLLVILKPHMNPDPVFDFGGFFVCEVAKQSQAKMSECVCHIRVRSHFIGCPPDASGAAIGLCQVGKSAYQIFKPVEVLKLRSLQDTIGCNFVVIFVVLGVTPNEIAKPLLAGANLFNTAVFLYCSDIAEMPIPFPHPGWAGSHRSGEANVSLALGHAAAQHFPAHPITIQLVLDWGDTVSIDKRFRCRLELE
jgi:hypothetical protein